MSRKLLRLLVILKGTSSIIVQSLLMRELLIVFFGNELTLSVILSFWLIGGFAGSLGGAWLVLRGRATPRAYALLNLAFCFSTLLAIFVIRYAKTIFHIPQAESLPLNAVLTLSLGSLLIPAAIDASLFSAAFHLLNKKRDSQILPLSRVYIWESAGIVAGGILSAFVLIHFLNSFQTLFLLATLHAVFCLIILKKEPNHLLRYGSYIILVLLVALNFGATPFHLASLGHQWPQEQILHDRNSPYGHIAVTRRQDQYNVYYNGLPVLNLPNPDIASTEDLIHLSLLTRPATDAVFFAGTAHGGYSAEILKYPVSRLTVAEIDPVFLKTLRSLHQPIIDAPLQDQRLFMSLSDARYTLTTSPQTYDVIFTATGLPTSLSLNRYMTQEFYQLAKKRLRNGGTLVVKTWGSLSYLSEEMKRHIATQWLTIQNVFDYIEMIPGDGSTIFLASDAPISLDPGVMAARLSEQSIATHLVNPAYLLLRLQKEYQNWFRSGVKTKLWEARINHDLRPSGLYDGLALYYSQFSQAVPRLFSGIQKMRFRHFAFLLLLIIAFGRKFFMPNRLRETPRLLLATVAASGFYAMALQMMVLIVFQSFYGSLFQWVALLTGGFMVGWATGAWILERQTPSWKTLQTLSLIDMAFPVLHLLLMAGIIGLCETGGILYSWIRAGFFGVSLCLGLFLGMELPLAYEIWQNITSVQQPEKKSAVAGWIYGADLAGACLGAFLAPLLFIPNLGIHKTIIILLVLKIANGLTIRSTAHFLKPMLTLRH